MISDFGKCLVNPSRVDNRPTVAVGLEFRESVVTKAQNRPADSLRMVLTRKLLDRRATSRHTHVYFRCYSFV